MTRSERQEQFVDTFVRHKARGTLVAATGFGKTTAAIKVIRRMRERVSDRVVIVVVPTQNLKDQWIAALDAAGQSLNSFVMIINSVIVMPEVHCDLFIADEIHRYGAPGFSKVFDVVKYRFILGLTATMKRLDGMHRMIAEVCPVIDTITVHEARMNGWIANYTEFNVGISMGEETRIKYKEHEKRYEEVLSFFGGDFELLSKCTSVRPIDVDGIWTRPRAVEYAMTLGWKGNEPKLAEDLRLKKYKTIWGNPGHQYAPDKVMHLAVLGLKKMQLMKSIIYDNREKLMAAAYLIEKTRMKTVTFAETIKSVEALDSMLPPNISRVVYHSKVKKPAGFKGTNDAYAKSLIDSFNIPSTEDGEHLIDVFLSARGVDEGADFPEAELGIRTSGTSSVTQHTQRRGRITRSFRDKISFFVNFYLRDTRDPHWLKKAQKNADDIIWCESVEEVIELLTL